METGDSLSTWGSWDLPFPKRRLCAIAPMRPLDTLDKGSFYTENAAE